MWLGLEAADVKKMISFSLGSRPTMQKVKLIVLKLVQGTGRKWKTIVTFGPQTQRNGKKLRNIVNRKGDTLPT